MNENSAGKPVKPKRTILVSGQNTGGGDTGQADANGRTKPKKKVSFKRVVEYINYSMEHDTMEDEAWKRPGAMPSAANRSSESSEESK